MKFWAAIICIGVAVGGAVLRASVWPNFPTYVIGGGALGALVLLLLPVLPVWAVVVMLVVGVGAIVAYSWGNNRYLERKTPPQGATA